MNPISYSSTPPRANLPVTHEAQTEDVPMMSTETVSPKARLSTQSSSLNNLPSPAKISSQHASPRSIATKHSSASTGLTKRLTSEMTLMDAVMAMCRANSGGMNPGAIRVLGDFHNKPGSPEEFIECLNKLDNAGIYSDRIWDLHQYVGGGNVEKTHQLLTAFNQGKISAGDLNHAVDNLKLWQGNL